MLHAVVDTNVWISAFLTPRGAPARVLAAVLDGVYVPVMSVPLLAELAGVLERPRLIRKYNYTREEGILFAHLLRAYAKEVAVSGTVRICRDPDDDIVIETALLGKAAYVVSRDDDLKHAPGVAAALEEAGIMVLTVQRFLDRLDEVRKSSQSGDAPAQEAE